MKYKIILGLLLVVLPFLGKAQFVYEFQSVPEATVLMNGKVAGTTPCKVKFLWEAIPDSGLVFRLKHEGYLDEVVVAKEKPRLARTFHNITLKKFLPHFDLDTANAIVEFDKLLAEFPSGKVIGHVRAYNSNSDPKEMTWEGFSRLGSDPIGVKTYDVLGTVGFNTPMKEEHQLFSNEKRVKRTSRFLLGAKLTELSVELTPTTYYAQSFKADVSLTIEWQVFDRSLNKVVWKEKSQGSESNKFTGTPSDEVLEEAYGNALYAFLGKGKLAEIVRAAGNSPVVETPADPTGDGSGSTNPSILPFIKMQKFESSPEMIQYSTQASVTISTDVGHGSGVIISEDGFVLTAAHVVEGVNRLSVIFSNGVELDAKVVSVDAKYDIALLDVPGSKYKALPLGQGLTVGLGEEVITIGTPTDIELGQSVSKGIVSGKRKHEDIVYLQTDVSVSPGNSGGPLINNKGQIIGIIQRKLIGSGIEGVGFALPIETAVKQLKITVAAE